MLRPLLFVLLILTAALARCEFTLDGGKPTGGTAAVGGGPPAPTPDYVLDSQGWYGGTSNGVQADSCSGPVTWAWTWTWQGNAPPPESVVLKVEARAQWSGPPGACDDGLGQQDEPTRSYAGPYLIGETQSGVKYVVTSVSGKTVSYTLSPSSSANWGTCSVGTRVTLTPVTISVAGTQTYNDAIESIVGMNQVASVSAGGYPLGNHDWSVGGGVQTFKYLNETTPDADGHYERKYMYQGSLSEINPHPPTKSFYASKPGQETVTCTVNVYRPDGVTLIGSAQAETDVAIVAPAATLQIDPDWASTTPPGVYGTLASSGSPHAVKIEFSTSVPAPFSGDKKAILQEVIENDTFHPSGDHEGFTSGWLDNAFPYIDSEQSAVGSYTTYDAPEITLDVSDTSFSINHNYRTSNMYRPTGGVYVPLLTRGWSWIMNGHKNANGSWSFDPGSGVVVQGGTGTPYSLEDAEFMKVFKNQTSYPYPGQ